MADLMITTPKDLALSQDDMFGERLLSADPVIVRRRVIWGECDPAQVVYTPRFADYLAAAYGWFSRVVLAGGLVAGDGAMLRTPMKALALEFHHVLRPEEMFDMTVYVLDVRQRTFDLLIRARSPEGEPRFEGRLSPIIVGADFRRVDMPASVRDALSVYQRKWPAPTDALR